MPGFLSTLRLPVSSTLANALELNDIKNVAVIKFGWRILI